MAVTSKNTKQEILDAYNEVLDQLKAAKAAKKTTADVIKEKAIEKTKEEAKEIVELDILNEDITNKYNSLNETIAMMKKEIEELYGIKTQADSLEALLNTYNDKNSELIAKNQAKHKELEAEFNEKKAYFDNLLKEANKKHDIEVSELRNKYKEEQKKIELEREREEESYNYDLLRERRIENDKWEDEKAAREKELSDKEKAVILREQDALEALDKVDGLTKAMEELEEQAAAQYQKGLKEGEANAEKVTAIRIAKMEAEANHRVEIAESKVSTLTESNEELKAKVNELQSKLDAAYTRVNEVALASARNSGQRIIESNK